MGIFANLIGANSHVIGPSAAPRVGLDRASARMLIAGATKVDPAIATAYAAIDEVQSIPHQSSSGVGDTYTLTISLPRLQIGTFTTAAIAYDATAATMETAIDVAATAAGVTDWTNGDITVAEAGVAGVSDGIVTLTFDGASVTEEPCILTVMTCTGWTQDGVLTRATPGQTNRNGAQALFAVGAIAGSLWICGATPVLTIGTSLKRPRMGLLVDLAMSATWEDGNSAIYNALRVLYPGMPATN